jgi:hypothetical protein
MSPFERPKSGESGEPRTPMGDAKFTLLKTFRALALKVRL